MDFDTPGGKLSATPNRLLVAGWTGRDRAAVDHHIEELAVLGVAPPSTVPLFYQCAPQLLTQQPTLPVLGSETSGEAEPFLLHAEGEIWLGVASDHTDRALEAHSVAHSKQVCGKPVAGALLPFAELRDRLDRLELRSWIDEGDGWVAYQEGNLAAILPLADLMEKGAFAPATAMLCGTLPAIGGVRPASRFRMELADPVANRTIAGQYETVALDIVA